LTDFICSSDGEEEEDPSSLNMEAKELLADKTFEQEI